MNSYSSCETQLLLTVEIIAENLYASYCSYDSYLAIYVCVGTCIANYMYFKNIVYSYEVTCMYAQLHTQFRLFRTAHKSEP